MVDLVHERVPQVRPVKLNVGVVRIDPLEEIFANKLCALLSRAEIRDLVDLRALEQVGCGLEEGLAAGAQKDGGLTPSQLAWVLSQVVVPTGGDLPGQVDASELATYRDGLVTRLVRLGHPGT